MSAPHDPLDEMRHALSQINNPYHRAMVCAWLTALEGLERIEVTLGSIAANLDDYLNPQSPFVDDLEDD